MVCLSPIVQFSQRFAFYVRSVDGFERALTQCVRVPVYNETKA